jgi:hypothetical protein
MCKLNMIISLYTTCFNWNKCLCEDNIKYMETSGSFVHDDQINSVDVTSHVFVVNKQQKIFLVYK